VFSDTTATFAMMVSAQTINPNAPNGGWQAGYPISPAGLAERDFQPVCGRPIP